MMNILKKIVVTTSAVLSLSTFVQASLTPQEEEDAFKRSNSAIGREIGDYTLIDQDGNRFRVRELIGKPMVISFIYTSCGHICPAITMSLMNAIKKEGNGFTGKFTALTVGFDVENDTPARMKEYGNNFTTDFKGWLFATADRVTIDAMAKDLGFYYKKTGGGFDHLNVVTVIDAKGRIYEHVYGIDFSPEEILKPLYNSAGADYNMITANEGQGILDKIILFCYKYDEATGAYKIDYPFLMKMVAEGIVILSVIFFVWGGDMRSFFRKRFSD